MTSDKIKKIIEAELSTFVHVAPAPGTTVGIPWTEEKVMSYIPKLRAALVEPYLRTFLLRDTYEQIKEQKEEYADYWVIAEDGGYIQWYDPATKEYGLAQKDVSDNQYVSIGVRGDLVGVYCAM